MQESVPLYTSNNTTVPHGSCFLHQHLQCLFKKHVSEKISFMYKCHTFGNYYFVSSNEFINTDSNSILREAPPKMKCLYSNCRPQDRGTTMVTWHIRCFNLLSK